MAERPASQTQRLARVSEVAVTASAGSHRLRVIRATVRLARISPLLDPGADSSRARRFTSEKAGVVHLFRIRDAGLSRKLVGLEIEGPSLSDPNTTFWPVERGGERVGFVTLAVHSPRLDRNIALARVTTGCTEIGRRMKVQLPFGPAVATVVEKPFYDPKKKIASSA